MDIAHDSPEAKEALRYAAGALAAGLPTEVMADVLNCLVGVDADYSLSDYQARQCETLFDFLCDFCPAAVAAATDWRSANTTNRADQ